MKKLIAIFLILLLILSFAACATPDDASKDNQSGDTDNPNGVNTGDPSGQGDDVISTLSSYEEYLKYIQSHRIPTYFVQYEDLAEFGDFDCLMFWEDLDHVQYQYYEYGFCEGDDGLPSLSVTISHAERKEAERTVLSSKTSADMRTCDLNVSANYYIGDIEYGYILGNLHWITWNSGGITFTATCRTNFNEYAGNNAIINKLLNRDTATEVKANFDTMIVNKTAAVQ